MKTYVTLLLSLLAVNAMADTKAYRSLIQGGEIVLTDEPCALEVQPKEMQRAYWYNDEGDTYDGCWRDDDRTIYFKWSNEGESRYPKSRFKVVDRW